MQNLRAHLPQLREEYNIQISGSSDHLCEASSIDIATLMFWWNLKKPQLFPNSSLWSFRLREITGIKVDLVSIRALKGEIGERICEGRRLHCEG